MTFQIEVDTDHHGWHAYQGDPGARGSGGHAPLPGGLQRPLIRFWVDRLAGRRRSSPTARPPALVSRGSALGGCADSPQVVVQQDAGEAALDRGGPRASGVNQAASRIPTPSTRIRRRYSAMNPSISELG